MRRRINDSTVRVGLSGSASVAVTFKGNLFELAADERQLISDLTDVLQKYESHRDSTHEQTQQQQAAEA